MKRTAVEALAAGLIAAAAVLRPSIAQQILAEPSVDGAVALAALDAFLAEANAVARLPGDGT